VFSLRIGSVDLEAVRNLSQRAETVDGFASLGAAIWRDLETPRRGSFDVVAEADGAMLAVAHVAPADNVAIGHRELGILVDEGARDVMLVTDLLELAVERAGTDETLIAWFPGSPEYATKAAQAAGFVQQRRLHRMERELPIDDVTPAWPDGVAVRTFRPGSDDEAWLELNNRAFAGHPEQGGWVRSTLERRLAEPWFDPDGLLLAVNDGGLAGFCWTKQHDHAIGEIFVIGVDPDHQGGGLGRALVVAGYRSLHERGSELGMLHVDATNIAAIDLYRSLGLEVVRTDTAYVREPR